MTDTQIAQQLCGWPVQKGRPGLGIKIDVNPIPNEQPDAIVFMNNQYDIVFLQERARRRGYELYLEDEGLKPTIYFGLSQNAAEAPVYQLEWGKSLVSFRPTLKTAKQFSAVTVHGWDRKSNSPIAETYTEQQLWKDLKKSPTETARLAQIAKAYEQRAYDVADEPAHTKKEARDRARAILENQSKKLIEAVGTTVGLPDLRSGSKVEILGFGVTSGKNGVLTGVSSDFDGEYYVTGSTHTIGNSGYQTQFNARRENEVSRSTAPQQ
jgi:phage protein D